ncbi:hypothetical protein [Halobacillus sp. A5]|uniref:hypothetical protein n=1 Tax=Halobacillus sp. A5 TaxID=2880263 RepID=UPI0020A642DD|nr:hypothetical protein [Halobacillus sp. A5]MCP3027092.1 hypothetical protein [Halobacillus sp. A5]
MLEAILSIILAVFLVISIAFTVKKRKKLGYKGIKSALTPICFYLIAVMQLFAIWFNLMGIISWILTMTLLLLGAYFTKYSIQPKEEV